MNWLPPARQVVGFLWNLDIRNESAMLTEGHPSAIGGCVGNGEEPSASGL